MNEVDGEPTVTWRQRLADPLAFYLSRRELRTWMASQDLDTLLDATSAYQGRGVYARIPAVQRRSEIRGLIERVRELSPQVVVEIGTFKGGTLFLFCRAARSVRHVVSIDLPGGSGGGGYHARRRRLYREFLHDRPGARLDLLQADSHQPETVAELRRLLGSSPIDVLYIDGDHSYEGVRRDFETYAPLVREGGMVAFHDIRTRRPGHEVYRLWDELRGRHRHEELIENPTGHMGIGILYL